MLEADVVDGTHVASLASEPPALRPDHEALLDMLEDDLIIAYRPRFGSAGRRSARRSRPRSRSAIATSGARNCSTAGVRAGPACPARTAPGSTRRTRRDDEDDEAAQPGAEDVDRVLRQEVPSVGEGVGDLARVHEPEDDVQITTQTPAKITDPATTIDDDHAARPMSTGCRRPRARRRARPSPGSPCRAAAGRSRRDHLEQRAERAHEDQVERLPGSSSVRTSR